MTEEIKKQELEKLKEWVKKILPDDHSKFNVETKYDPKITFEENKGKLRTELKTFIKNLKEQAKNAETENSRLDKEKLNAAEAEVEEYNKTLTFNDNKDLETFFATIKRGINKLCQGYCNLIFIRGRGGIGKSYQIRKELIKNNTEFVEVCGEVTEAYLYRLLYENNGKIIWFKDVVKLLQNIGSLNLLKSATETEDQKILTKNNYSKDQGDLPNKFMCKCKFIFDYNNLFGVALKGDFEALATRGDYKELAFCDDDIKKIMRLIATTDIQKEVTEFIINQFENSSVVKLNLRTQWKAVKTYEYCKKNNLGWKVELGEELNNVTKTRAMIYTLIGTKAVRVAELKKLLMREGLVGSIRSADRRILDWLYLEELYKVSAEDKNYYVCINNIRSK